MRLSGTKTGSANQYNGLGDQLYDLGGARPTLDLNFASNGSLVDSVTGKTLVTHTRASSATYVDGDGIIKNAVTNLLTESETFAGYSVQQLTQTSESIQTPFGGFGDVQKYTEDTSNSSHRLFRSVSISGQFTASIFVKIHSGTRLFYFQSDTSLGRDTAVFDLVLKSVTSVTAGNGFTDAGITDYGNGWLRISVTTPGDPDGNALYLWGLRSNTNNSYLGDGTSGVYLWGAQVEQSSTVGEYVKTTSTINSAPRFDHDPATGESLGLLVEESRENNLLYSTNFDNAYWYQTYITTNTVTAPDDTLTAATYEGIGGGSQSFFNITSQTVVASRDYNFSFYVKLGTMSASSFKFAVYDISNSAFVEQNIVPSVTPTTTGWTRITYSFTTPAGCTLIRVYPFRNTTTFSSSTVYLWGAQLEEGSFPTSYIPTEGSTVTRAADVTSITGTNFSSWYNQTEGTVFTETERPDSSRPNSVVTSISDGTSANRIEIRSSSASNANARTEMVESGSGQFTRGSITSDTAYKKLAFAYATDNVNAAGNGTIAGADDTLATIPTVNQLYFGNDNFLTDYRPGHIKRVTYWPTRLSNDTLETITV